MTRNLMLPLLLFAATAHAETDPARELADDLRRLADELEAPPPRDDQVSPVTSYAALELHRENWVLDEAAKVRPIRVHAAKRSAERGPHVTELEWRPVGSQPVLDIYLTNDDARPYLLSKVEVLNEHRSGDHAGIVRVNGKPVYGDRVLAEIAPRTTARISVLIRDHETVGRHMSLVLSSAEQYRQVWVDPVPTWKLVEDPPPPDENIGRVTLSFGYGYGVAKISMGDTNELVGATEGRARLGRGMSASIDLDAELALARTGETALGTATIARLAAAVRVHLRPSWYRPYARAGLGFAVSRLGGTWDAGIDVVVSAGIDAALGPVSLGVALDGAVPLNGGMTVIVPGAKLGISW